MKLKGPLRIAVILLLILLVVGLDQLTKSIVRNHLTEYSRIGFLGGHVTLGRVENTGAFLSLGDSLSGPFRTILLNLIPLVAVIFGLVYVLIKPMLNPVTVLGIIFIVGGGIGNIYDRITHGSVTDFMHIDFVIFQTGVFNLADMFIMAGTFILVIHAYFSKEEPQTSK